MAYASLTHVNGLCPARTFSATSLPSQTQTIAFLDQKAGELDAIMLAAGYQLPVTAGATIALKVLERANALGAWAEVEAAAPLSDDEDRAMKAWLAACAQLDPEQKGPTLQLDLPKNTMEAYARGKSFEDAGIASGPQPFFTLDMEL